MREAWTSWFTRSELAGSRSMPPRTYRVFSTSHRGVANSRFSAEWRVLADTSVVSVEQYDGLCLGEFQLYESRTFLRHRTRGLKQLANFAFILGDDDRSSSYRIEALEVV